MKFPNYIETPFQFQLTFSEVIERFEKIAADPLNIRSAEAYRLLEEVSLHPELREGIIDIAQLEENAGLISRLMVDFFPPELTHNEIKGISMPYRRVIFNRTARFNKIIDAAGPDFELEIRDLDEHQAYVMSCCIILNEFYGTKLDFSKPMFIDIPNAAGILRHYRILYNADFMHIQPTDCALTLTREEIDELLDNYDDLELWKSKFPKESWVIRGFAIMNMFDATVENAVSMFKEKLLLSDVGDFRESLENIFRAIYNIPDIRIGFMIFNKKRGMFDVASLAGPMQSFILEDGQMPSSTVCGDFYGSLVNEQTYFAISDVKELETTSCDDKLVEHLLKQDIQSIILAPVIKSGNLLGVLEVASSRPRELHSVNARKLELVMPYLTDTTERLMAALQNQVEAIIQNNYTTIHSSVYWRFREEAQTLIRAQRNGEQYTLQEIVFDDVYPLYGQVDIQGSSESRNLSIQKDLRNQLHALLLVLQQIEAYSSDYNFTSDKLRLETFLDDLSFAVLTSTEQVITEYLDSVLHYKLQQITEPSVKTLLGSYFTDLNNHNGGFFSYRRKYESTVARINNQLTRLLDKRQEEAQRIYPHYYERFKTDGVEHTLYIGASINQDAVLDLQKLHELRLWQLRVICEMESEHHLLKPSLPYPFEVTSLILTYHTSIAIRFRMDEKRFDVDGTYNARFEIIKKRIDKAHVRGTAERITQAGKVAIVYAHQAEELEYRQMISQLQQEGILDAEVENLEVEDLQGVIGLHALRVKITHK